MNTDSHHIFKIFVDFDGTISRQDIGEAMFLEFGDREKVNSIIASWINNEITSVESWHLLCDTVKKFEYDKFERFLSLIKIDPYFHDFVGFCDKNNFEIAILSDGMNFYIDRFLKRESLSGLRVYSNDLKISDDNRLIPSFPYTDEECKKCANCKRNHILSNSSDSEYTVYVGDGYSDTCPAQFCDFIFAKSSLLKYCEINRISYFPYKDFNDVILRLNELRTKKRLKKRHQAELKRKEVYQMG